MGQLSDPSLLVISSTIPSNQAPLNPCNYSDKDSIAVPELRASQYFSEFIEGYQFAKMFLANTFMNSS